MKYEVIDTRTGKAVTPEEATEGNAWVGHWAWHYDELRNQQWRLAPDGRVCLLFEDSDYDLRHRYAPEYYQAQEVKE